ncbi:receptor kinase-like protein Xa21 [Quercus robur]|uniref:receptor kinase-like protein Xa21 n=1 Tax=Quercus robur TaxID=38942 RepID=UPI002163E1B3|nr:receptor kinase-like protein Xa21 [Quercus robur]
MVIVVIVRYILPTMIAAILALFLIFVLMRCRKRDSKLKGQGDLLPLATWRRITYLELEQATYGFNEGNLVGKGSFGSVYRGKLSDGTSVAVKVFNLNIEEGFKSFEAECGVMRSIRHRNLVKIISSCSSIDFKALVLEYMPKGSLKKWLYSHNYFLDMIERLGIMVDVASSLEYLHHGCALPVVHCDLKPNNILLDNDMVAHVSDFGISKFLSNEDSTIQTMTLATIGYMAPKTPKERSNMRDIVTTLKNIKLKFLKDVGED